MAKDPTASNTYVAARYGARPAPVAARPAGSVTVIPVGAVGARMSDKQRDFVATLVARDHDYQRKMIRATEPRGEVTQDALTDALAVLTPALTVRVVQRQLNRTDVDARTLIDILLANDKALAARVRDMERKAAQRADAAPAAPAAARQSAEDGKSYRTSDGRVFHAYKTQSGRLCVKLWDGEAFTYWGLASRMPAAQEMTLAEAEEFGQATGTCAICMRHLTNDESVARGIGPICASRY